MQSYIDTRHVFPFCCCLVKCFHANVKNFCFIFSGVMYCISSQLVAYSNFFIIWLWFVQAAAKFVLPNTTISAVEKFDSVEPCFLEEHNNLVKLFRQINICIYILHTTLLNATVSIEFSFMLIMIPPFGVHRNFYKIRNWSTFIKEYKFQVNFPSIKFIKKGTESIDLKKVNWSVIVKSLNFIK